MLLRTFLVLELLRLYVSHLYAKVILRKIFSARTAKKGLLILI